MIERIRNQGTASKAGKVVANRHPAPARSIPILPEFRNRILPVLVILWLAALLAYALIRQSYIFPVAVWATVTIIMLWPVGRTLGRPYLSYRSPLFILGVFSMAYIIFTGFAMETSWSFEVKSVIFFGLVFDLTVFGIIPGLRPGISRPVGMFFRPDLLFGDGRVLCCGIIALVLGMRLVVGAPPPLGQPWPLPIWDWWGILFAMLAGFIPLIPGRGMMKLLMRMARLRRATWTGWAGIIITESILVLAALSVGYGFHSAFLGKAPFTVPVKTDFPNFLTALAIILLSALFLIFVRGGYKKSIGEPFIMERVDQTFVKEILLVAGIIPLFYGFMMLLIGRPLALNSGPALYVGLVSFIWGIVVLIPFRVLVQVNQRRAILGQMAGIVLPTLGRLERENLLRKIMNALSGTSEAIRQGCLLAMLEGLSGAPDEVRKLMTELRVDLLVRLPENKRKTLVRSSAAAIARMKREERVAAMADMMGAVAELPEDKRRLMAAEMAAVVN